MALPDVDLQLNFDPDELTLDEMQILETYSVKLFRAFVTRYGNWTAEQVGRITRREWLALQEQFYAKLLEVISPKVSATP